MSKKDWLTTDECIAAVLDMNVNGVQQYDLESTYDEDTGMWLWQLFVHTDRNDGNTEDLLWHTNSASNFLHEDEAANAGYLHAYKYYKP